MKLSILAINNTDRTITVHVDNNIYEYWITQNFEGVLANVRALSFAGADGKALTVLKKSSHKCDKIKTQK